MPRVTNQLNLRSFYCT